MNKYMEEVSLRIMTNKNSNIKNAGTSHLRSL